MRHWRLLPFLVSLLASAWGFFTPGEDLPSSPVSDKLEHAAIFAVLALTARFAGLRTVGVAVGLASYAVVSEVLQSTLPINRDGDWHDLVADSIGIAVGLVGWAVLRRARRSSSAPGRPPG